MLKGHKTPAGRAFLATDIDSIDSQTMQTKDLIYALLMHVCGVLTNYRLANGTLLWGRLLADLYFFFLLIYDPHWHVREYC